MSRSDVTLCFDHGECVAVSSPTACYPGFADAFTGEQCYNIMRAYYGAVAASCRRSCGGFGECRGDAGCVGRYEFDRVESKLLVVGGQSRQGEDGVGGSSADDNNLSGGLVDGKCRDPDVSSQRVGGVPRESVITNDDDVSCGDGGDVSVESAGGKLNPSGNRGIPRGPNFLRNHANRLARRERKRAAKDSAVRGARTQRDSGHVGEQFERTTRRDVDGVPFSHRGAGQDVNEPRGFWNSCEPDTRKLLIESKARMHAAENLRKAKEAEQRCQELDSPYNTMVKAVKMIEFAQKQAAKENDNKVYGWAKTVATRSAEDLARSTPDSVPSFSEFEEKLAASSQSSFELELARKDAEIESIKKDNDKLEMEVAELKLSKGKIENKLGLNAPIIPSNRSANVKARKFGDKQREVGYSQVWPREDTEVFPEGFVPTPQQPWPHVRLTYADCHERNL